MLKLSAIFTSFPQTGNHQDCWCWWKKMINSPFYKLCRCFILLKNDLSHVINTFNYQAGSPPLENVCSLHGLQLLNSLFLPLSSQTRSFVDLVGRSFSLTATSTSHTAGPGTLQRGSVGCMAATWPASCRTRSSCTSTVSHANTSHHKLSRTLFTTCLDILCETVYLEVEQGFDEFLRQSLQLQNCNSPEGNVYFSWPL